LTAPCSAASCDITVKMVVPTFGSLVSIRMDILQASRCIAPRARHGDVRIRDR
jgi:hypothetical protein